MTEEASTNSETALSLHKSIASIDKLLLILFVTRLLGLLDTISLAFRRFSTQLTRVKKPRGRFRGFPLLAMFYQVVRKVFFVS